MDLRLTCLMLALGAAGCGSTLVRAAEQDKLAEFRSSLGAALKHGVGAGEARDVALSRARYEVATASGEDGARALDELQSCATILRGSLMQRANHDDETAAHAALMAEGAGLVPPLSYARHVTSEAPHWRAVGARSLSLAEDPAAPPCDVGWHKCGSAKDTQRARAGWWRRHLMLDPYPEVRRGALKAAAIAADVHDGPAVLDAARRDPDGEARQLAISAAGHIATLDTVLGLVDRWPSAPEEERTAIVGAWAAAMRSLGTKDVHCGGPAEPAGCVALRQLWHVAEADAGLPSLLAALELTHSLGEERAPADADATALGISLGVIERAIDEAPTRIRIEAIDSAPLSQARLLEAVIEAASSEDPPVSVAALARLSEPSSGVSAEERKKAVAVLRERAKDTGPSAERAAVALAEAGDESVLERLAKDAQAASSADRRRAATGYAELGKLDKALALVADADGVVRSHAACAILRAADK